MATTALGQNVGLGGKRSAARRRTGKGTGREDEGGSSRLKAIAEAEEDPPERFPPEADFQGDEPSPVQENIDADTCTCAPPAASEALRREWEGLSMEKHPSSSDQVRDDLFPGVPQVVDHGGGNHGVLIQPGGPGV